MLRILHSLPRTHKLVILPVATMVTVLGVHQLVATFDASGGQKKPLPHLVVLPQLDLAKEFQAQASVAKVDTPFAGVPFRVPHDTGTPLTPSSGLSLVALQAALELPENADDAVGGTSYEDISADPMYLEGSGVELENELAAKVNFVPEWESYTVQKGDTFAVMAERTLGLGFSDVMALLDKMPDKSVLTRWRVGHSFDFKLDESGELMALRVMKNARSGYLIERNSDQNFDVASFDKASEATQRLFSGTLSGSFARSASATGLSNAEIAQLSSLLAKKLDFRRKARKGDRFQVLVETNMIEGKATDSRILAARYQGKKMNLTVVRNTTDDRFYTPEGQSLDPAFDRYPLKGKHRISSPFNLKRKHPITGRVSPHRGTDFAVRTGTAVDAPADGRVIKSTHQALAGNYIVIKHDNGYKTRYMHLSKRLVSEGERVKRGQKIALSGNTGRSTGPHLHYEVMVNNRQVDAMRVKLPHSKSLSGRNLAAFKQQSKPLLAQLDSGESNGTVVASRAITPRSSNEDS